MQWINNVVADLSIGQFVMDKYGDLSLHPNRVGISVSASLCFLRKHHRNSIFNRIFFFTIFADDFFSFKFHLTYTDRAGENLKKFVVNHFLLLTGCHCEQLEGAWSCLRQIRPPLNNGGLISQCVWRTIPNLDPSHSLRMTLRVRLLRSRSLSRTFIVRGSLAMTFHCWAFQQFLYDKFQITKYSI